MWRWMMALLILGLATVGCRDEDSPVPEYNVGMPVGDTGRTLVPTNVPPMKHQTSLLGAAASAEEVAQARPAPAGEAAANVIRIQVDASTPEALIQGFVAIVEAGNFAQLADILVPEQQEVARELFGGFGAFIPALKALDAKWKEKFPDAPLPGMDAAGPGMGFLSAPKVSGIEPKSDTEAEVTLEVPEGGKAQTLTLRKIDDAWRVELPDFSMPTNPEALKMFTGMFAGMAGFAQQFTQRLENNEFASANEAKAALDQSAQEAMAPFMAKMMEEMGKAMQAGPGESAPPPPEGGQPPAPETLEPTQPGDAPANEPAGEKPRSQLEQDMDNAAGRAAMGGL